MTEQANESGEKLSEIARLTARPHAVGASVAMWNTWYMVFVALTVVLAAGVFITQFIASRRSTELSGIQEALITEKDRIAGIDSKAKEAGIAEALRQAGISNEAAGLANERAQKAQASLASAEQHSAEANAKAEGFRADIARANASAAQAEAQVADAHRAAAEANRIAESERLARLQLEARLADRVVTPDQKLRLTQVFSPLKGQTVDVVIFGDTPETSRTADAIIGSLQTAGILFNFFHPLSGGMAQGVVIGVRADAPEIDKQSGSQLVAILRETFGSGVGLADWDRLAVTGTGTFGGTPGAAPAGKSTIRLQIAPK